MTKRAPGFSPAVAAMAVWVGGLVAFLVLREGGRRFGLIALGCIVTLAASGLLLALVTFAFAQVVEVFFLNFKPTGAAEGIRGIFPFTNLWYVFGFYTSLRTSIIPVFFVFPIAFTLNRLGQHYDIDPSDPAKWGTLMKGHWFWDFAFLNSNYHLEHHYFPGVPFYRLPALQAALRQQPRPLGTQIHGE